MMGLLNSVKRRMGNREHQPSSVMQPSPSDDHTCAAVATTTTTDHNSIQRGNAIPTSFTSVSHNRVNIRKPLIPHGGGNNNTTDAISSSLNANTAHVSAAENFKTDSGHIITNSKGGSNSRTVIPHTNNDNSDTLTAAGGSRVPPISSTSNQSTAHDNANNIPSTQQQTDTYVATDSSEPPSPKSTMQIATHPPPPTVPHNHHHHYHHHHPGSNSNTDDLNSIPDAGGGGNILHQQQRIASTTDHHPSSTNEMIQRSAGDLAHRCCYSGESKSTIGLFYAVQEPRIFSKLPHLKDLSGQEYVEVLRQKVAACRDVVFDFRSIGAEYFRNEKEDKKITLNEILVYVNDPRKSPLEQMVEEIIQMVSKNIFRPLPPSTAPLSSLILTDPDENEPRFETAWPHLQIVYEILLRMIMSNEINPKCTKKYIDHSFVLKLLNLFASEDPRERDYLKTIMHRLYGKIMALRAFIRKAIQHIFYRYIHEQDGQPGVSELLEILGSIINGFAQPLKEEHKLFLKRCMIPLHKSRHLIAFHQQLTYCMAQYIEKDEKLIEPIVNGILRYWPVTSTPKEVLFINEIEEILELTPPAEFQKILDPLFKRMALCIQSPHFQVAERVLFLWNNTRIVKLINQHRAQLFPLVIGALYKNSKGHWNATVHGLTYNVCKLLAETDPGLFDRCNDETMKKEEKAEKERIERKRFWMALKQQQQQQLLQLKREQMQLQQQVHHNQQQQQQQHNNNDTNDSNSDER